MPQSQFQLNENLFCSLVGYKLITKHFFSIQQYLVFQIFLILILKTMTLEFPSPQFPDTRVNWVVCNEGLQSQLSKSSYHPKNKISHGSNQGNCKPDNLENSRGNWSGLVYLFYAYISSLLSYRYIKLSVRFFHFTQNLLLSPNFHFPYMLRRYAWILTP